jgi:hypothetical protein
MAASPAEARVSLAAFAVVERKREALGEFPRDGEIGIKRQLLQ